MLIHLIHSYMDLRIRAQNVPGIRCQAAFLTSNRQEWKQTPAVRVVGARFIAACRLAVGEPTHPQHMAAKEFELATSWGMPAKDALAAGTKVSAEALGMDHSIGSLEVGKLADIIALPATL